MLSSRHQPQAPATDSGAAESPLDVLSRAATLVSAGAPAGGQAAPPSPSAGEHQRQQTSSTTDARRRTGAQLYLLVPLSLSTNGKDQRRRAEVPLSPEAETTAPLDMRRCQRPGEEPPVNHPPRPSVITCAPGRPAPPTRPRTQPCGALAGCDIVHDDPDIDEHFRRSLGSNYERLLRGRCQEESDHPLVTSNAQCPQPLNSLVGNSVDDHFAKALGDTWQRLQRRGGVPEIERTCRRAND